MRFHQQISVILSLLAALALGACESGDQDLGDEEVSMDDIAVTADEIDPGQFAEKLAARLPEWDGAVLRAPRSVAKESFLEARGPLAPAASFTKAPLSFSRETLSGKAVYTAANKQEAVMVRAEIGFWKYVTPPPADGEKGGAVFTDAEALQKTEELFRSFGLPADEAAGHVATGVGEADLGPDGVLIPPRVTARHVRLFREVNGIPVFGSHLMATYTLDGTPFRVEAAWPPFALKPGASRAISRERALQELTEHLAQKYRTPKAVKEMATRLVYLYDEDELTFDPVIVVHIRPTNEENGVATVRYSLTAGLKRKDDTGLREHNDVDDPQM